MTELEKQLKELRERNEIRLQEAKERLGTKWLLHPDNRVENKFKTQVQKRKTKA